MCPRQVYEGEWLDGQRSGPGSLRLPGGDVFEGHWLLDKKEGPGEQTQGTQKNILGRGQSAARFSAVNSIARRL